jgi:hypothetical protein
MNSQGGILSGDGAQGLKILAWLVGLICLILIVTSGVMFYWNLSFFSYLELNNVYTEPIMVLGYGIVGLLILSYRPDHGIGWLFLAVAFLSALNIFATQYAVYGLLVTTLPGAKWMAWLQSWFFYLAFPAPIVLLFLLFPDGRLPSPHWRPLVWLGVLSALSLIVGELVRPGMLVTYITEDAIRLGVLNPTGVSGWGGFSDALNGAWFVSIILVPAALFAPFWRYRRARGVERQQLKWFVFFAILILLLLPLAFIQGGTAGELIFILIFLILPVATAVAIMRHRLYDIDVIVKRTLLYGLLTVTLAGIYLASIILLQALFTAVSGQESAAAIVLSTLIIAALFNPLRSRLQVFIDRRFYRRKYDAQKTLANFATIARDEVDLEQLSAALVQVVAETVQPESLSLWLKTPAGSAPHFSRREKLKSARED